MRNKTLLALFLIVIIGLLLWFSIWQQPTPDAPHSGASDEDVNSLTVQPTTNNNRESAKATAEPTEVTDPLDNDSKKLSEWQQKILQEIDSRVFSDDPYVELHSLEFLVGQCRDQDIIDRLFVGSGTLYHSQQQLAQKLQLECDKLSTQYKEYLSYPEHEQLVQAFEPNSRMGRLLKQLNSPNLTSLDRNELSSSVLQQAIKEQNSSSLMYSVFIARFGSFTNLPLAAVINSNDEEYVNQMSSLAMMQIACQYQDGRTCESTSFYMIIMCSQQPSACGLDFSSWYQRTTLPGMQQDVDKLVTYFSQFGQ